MISLLKIKPYGRLFVSYGISSLGRWFDMTAMLVLFGFIWQADPLTMAFIPIAYALPPVLFSQFAAVWIDKFNKIRLMQAADAAVALLSIALIFAPGTHTALLILLLRACFSVVHFPAQQSLVKEVVPAQLIVKAVTLNGAVNEAAKIIGPFLGGALTAAFSPLLCIAFNAAAHLLSAFLLQPAVKSAGAPLPPFGKETSAFWKDWKEGWLFVFQRRALWFSMFFGLLSLFAIHMVDIQITVLLRNTAPEQPELVGWIMGASGAGALLAMIILQRLKEIRTYGTCFGSSMLLTGLGFGGIGLFHQGLPSYLPIISGFTAGIGVGIFSVTIGAVLHRETTSAAIARVSGIYNSLSSFIVLTAPLAGGMLVSVFSPAAIFSAVAAALLFLGITGIVVQQRLWSAPAGKSASRQTRASSAE